MSPSPDETKPSLAEIVPALAAAMSDALAPLRRLSGELDLLWKRELEQARKAAEAFEASIARAFEPLHDLLQQLPGRTRDALGVLGEHGWYLDLEMDLPTLWQLQAAIDEGQAEAAEEWLIGYYRRRLDAIKAELAARHPDRERIIERALAAHTRGEYELSVPVLLAQADGICAELTGYGLFRTRDRAPRIAEYVRRLPPDRLERAFLDPLTRLLPVLSPEGQRDPNSKQLNRHAVLHGESLDYGTEMNSLKAVSLLQYVSAVLGTDRAHGRSPGGSAAQQPTTGRDPSEQ